MGLLDGKVAIVTGAGRGVGRGEALELARQGAKVVVNDLGGGVDGSGADKGPAHDVVQEIKSRGGEAVPNSDSVTDWAGAENLVGTAIDTFGKLDILVNNAGILRDRMIVKMTEEDFDSVIAVHLKGTFACTHHAASYWREQSKAGNQPRAAIVNTVSSAGLQGNIGQANYGAAKAGIAALTVITSLELQQYGVRANAIAPGGATRMSGGVISDEAKQAIADAEAAGEFHRLDPGNSAPMVAWLASDEALHVTGQVFKAVGNEIAHYRPWSLGASAENLTREGPARWDPARITNVVNTDIFGCRNGGLRMRPGGG
ncbi:MAG: SDR family NAD(P)-dependent oxidoreductase [Actinobacteria bacterium ATB1]|nr:SDR family NAD(P)-dependent oxidoreductase [Actinobacteria bacterium ATB1]